MIKRTSVDRYGSIVGILLLVCFAAVSAVAQNPTPQSTPITPATPVRTPQRTPEILRQPHNIDWMRSSQIARELKEEQQRLTERQRVFQKYVEDNYRKASHKEEELLRPAASAKIAYASFLKLSDTGLVKLIPDAGCSKNSQIISAEDTCLRYSMPGHGSSYSFRTKGYRIARMSDIAFAGGAFQTPGFWVRGILTPIGDVPIEGLNMDSPEIRYLRDYLPSIDYAAVLKADKDFARGVSYGGRLFAKTLTATPNRTYALRSSAYRGEIFRSVAGFRFNELSYDSRKDVLIVFRIAAVEPDGSVTLVWRRLFSRQSPVLAIPKPASVVK